MSEHTAEKDAAFLQAARAGYDAALSDVREAINESLNLAHLREALRYLRYEPRVIPPGSTLAPATTEEGLPNCEGWTCQSCGADNFIPNGFVRSQPPTTPDQP